MLIPFLMRWLSFCGSILLGVAVAAVAETEPTAYWSFDRDLIASVGGPAFNGVASNGAAIDTTRSRFGGASLRLRRALQQYVRIPQSPFGGGSYTYAAWYYLDIPAITGSNRYMVLEASDGNTWPASYGLRLTNGEQVANVFTDDNGSVGGTPQTSFPARGHQAWRHITTTYDAETYRLEIFLDGEGVAVLWLRPGATQIAGSTYLNIGSHRDPTGRNWEGWIDEVAVWNRVLSQEEIALLQVMAPDQIARYGRAGYENWIAQFAVPPALRGPGADASGDGVSNLMKYVQGISPLESAAGAIPRMTLAGSAGARRAIVTLERNPLALGLMFTLEASADLMQWQPVDAVIVNEESEVIYFMVEDLP
jgi:hypothetical protein